VAGVGRFPLVLSLRFRLRSIRQAGFRPSGQICFPIKVRSLSHADIGRLGYRAASFPTLFSTASGVSGLVAGPSSAFRRMDC
jgi:hypothetical protein